MLTELVRRWAREYDRYIVASTTSAILAQKEQYPEEFEQHNYLAAMSLEQNRTALPSQSRLRKLCGLAVSPAATLNPQPMRLRPTLAQQIIRSVLYAVQFTSAYLIMLIVMSFNAYIFISVILGATLGHFVATWDTLGVLPPSLLAQSTTPLSPTRVHGATPASRDTGDAASKEYANPSPLYDSTAAAQVDQIGSAFPAATACH